ncbi:MAG: hypothetical protein ACTSYI_16090 [Promethearchaeota archaeon]
MGTKEKLEKTIISFYRGNLTEIEKTMANLLESYQATPALELGNKFILVCKEIQQDPRFQYMAQFQTIVENAHHNLQQEIAEIEVSLSKGQGKTKPIRSSSDSQLIEQFKPIYSKFYSEIDQIQAELYENMSAKPDNEFEFYLNKSRFLTKSNINREFNQEQEKLISQFRKTLTKTQKQEISKPLSLRQELKLFDDYRLAVEYHLVDIEDKGWFNTVRLYGQRWIKYLQKIAIFHAKHFREAVVQKVEKEIIKIEKWLGKIEKKYDKSLHLNTAQIKLLNQTIKDMIISYRGERKQLKRYEEDARILKKISQLT